MLRRFLLQRVEMIGPCLHHLRALREIGGVVVCRAHGVSLLMRQLQLDELMLMTELVQHRRSDAAKAMAGVEERNNCKFERING